LKSLLSLPQRLLSNQLAFRTISDSDEEEEDFGGRPLKPWQKVFRSLDWFDSLFRTIDDDKTKLLLG
jgi:hypothetical protein